MEQASAIGLDIAKHVFQAHGADAAGQVVFRKRLTRTKLLGFFAAQTPCVVAMEACAGSHIMTGNRRSDRAKPESPGGGRVGKACGAKGIAAPVQGPNGQIPAVLTVRGPGRRCEWLPIVIQDVPMAYPPRVRGHSRPIAKTAGEAV
jgi:hypothetical protein